MTESAEARLVERPRDPVGLLERGRELHTLAELVDRASDGLGSAALVEGPAGIGKTALIAEVAARAEATGALVLAATGRELERGFPFGVARQLFEPVLGALAADERAEVLSGAAAPAERLLGPVAASSTTGDAAFAIAHALYWVTVNLAARRLLLLTVDDVHRADAASLLALGYLAPRLEDLPAVLILARRTGDGTPSPGLDAVLGATPLRTIAPAALSPAATAEVVRAVASPAASDAFCRACHDASGGNPLYVRELAVCAVQEGVPADDDGARRFEDLTPQTISRPTTARIAALGDSPRRLAEAVAVLEHGSLPVAAALAELDDDAFAAAGAALADAGLLADGLPLQFAHPVLRSAVYGAIPAPARAIAHRRAARLLVDSGDVAGAASHLLEVEPWGEPWAAETLRRAGTEALARGAPQPALRLLRRALDEVPGADPPPELLLELGRAELACGEPAARERLESALAAADEPSARATVLGTLSIACYLGGDLGGALDAAGRALDAIDGHDAPALEARLLYPFAMAGRSHPQLVDAVRARLADLRPDDDGRVAASARAACVAFDRYLRGEPVDETRALARRAVSDERLLDLGWDGALARQIGVFTLVGIDDLDLAEAALQPVFELARRDGSPMEHAVAAQDRLWSRWRRGLVPQALADAAVVLDLAAQGWQLQAVPARVARSDCLAEQGDLDAAAAALELDPAIAAYVAGTWGDPWLHFARSRLLLERGDAAGALAEALECGRKQLAIDAPNPSYCAWRSRAALAAARLGDREHAKALCEEELRLARAFGAPRGIGVALRTAGVVEGGDEGVALLREAVAELARSPADLEHARALVELGAALRRMRRPRDARGPLRDGLALARECGATVLATRARDELRAAGGRIVREARRSVDALSPRELRIAELAADGLGNRDIAQALFITRKTVEAHMRTIFRKLGIASRTELGPLLGPRRNA